MPTRRVFPSDDLKKLCQSKHNTIRIFQNEAVKNTLAAEQHSPRYAVGHLPLKYDSLTTIDNAKGRIPRSLKIFVL